MGSDLYILQLEFGSTPPSRNATGEEAADRTRGAVLSVLPIAPGGANLR